MPHNKNNISIRKKVIIIIITGIIILGFTQYLVTNSVLIPSYMSIENQYVKENIFRVEEAINEQIKNLEIKLRDWSQWDSTYTYIKKEYLEFPDVELKDVTFLNLEINSVLIFDLNGNLVFEKTIDLKNNMQISGDSILDAIMGEIDIIEKSNAGTKTSGILQTQDGLIMISIQPVLQGDGSGPIVGSIAFIRNLDDAMVQKLQNITHLSTDLFISNTEKSNKEIAPAVMQLSDTKKEIIIPKTEKIINGYFALYDLTNKRVGVVRIELDRNIYNNGKSNIRMFMIIGVLATTIIGILIYVFIELLVLVRMSRLGKEISEIGIGKLEKVTEDSADEIGQLAKIINQMTTDLKSSQIKEREALQTAKDSLVKLEERVQEVEKLNKFMVGRELEMTELKKKIGI